MRLVYLTQLQWMKQGMYLFSDFFFFQFFPFQTGKNNCIIFVMLEGIKLLE